MAEYARFVARRHSTIAVRPLGPEPRRSQGRRPVLLIALGLFVVGAAAGYLIGLPGDTPDASATVTTTEPPVAAGSSTLSVAEYAWTQQSSPEFTPRLWAVHTATEVDGYIYALITDDIQNRASRGLWRTADGARWEPVTFDLGPGAVATDLDVRGESLVVSGWEGARPTVWTSSPLDGTPTLAWEPIGLEGGELPIGELVPVFSDVHTAINSAGEHVVLAAMQYSLDHHDLQQVVESNGLGASLPEIAVHESQIWTKTTSAAGNEVVSVLQVPDPITVQAASGPVGTWVTELYAWAMWVSADGSSFSAADPIKGIDVAPQVMGFGDGFIATTWTAATDTYDMLLSVDGREWGPMPGPVPEECGATRPGVVGAELLLVAGEDFAHTCTTQDGTSWQVHHTPQTAVADNAILWITGNETRFLALAINSQERAVLESADGTLWRQITFEPEAKSGSAYLAGERVLNVARVGGRNSPRPWTIWVGQRLES